MSSPFIHLLKTPKNKYFYDVQRNAIIRVSPDLYKQLASGEVVDSLEAQEFRKYGLLSEKRVSRIEHSCTAHIQDYLDRSLVIMTLQVTQQCNLRCNYCLYSEKGGNLQRHHNNKVMTLDTAKKAIDFLCSHSMDSSTVSIGFYGGEPLLEFPLIRETVAYAESVFAGKTIQFNITTNATLLTDEIADFLVEKKFSTTLSMDGPKEIQDAQRKFPDGSGTFDVVFERVQRLLKRHPDYLPFLSVNMVIDTRRSLDKPMQLMKLLPGVRVMMSEVDDFYMDEKIVPCAEYREQYEYQIFLASLYALGLLEKSCVSPAVQPLISNIQNTVAHWQHNDAIPEPSAPSGPCIPGAQRLFVAVDGTLYPCERVSEVSSYLSIGTIFSGFDYIASRRMLNVAQLTENECKTCWAFRFCAGCIRDTFDGTQNPSAQKRLSKCPSHKAMADLLLHGAVMLKEIPLYYRKQLQEGLRNGKEAK